MSDVALVLLEELRKEHELLAAAKRELKPQRAILHQDVAAVAHELAVALRRLYPEH